MPRFAVHTLDDAPPSRPPLADSLRQLGKVLNIYGEMADAPVVLAITAPGITA